MSGLREGERGRDNREMWDLVGDGGEGSRVTGWSEMVGEMCMHLDEGTGSGERGSR